MRRHIFGFILFVQVMPPRLTGMSSNDCTDASSHLLLVRRNSRRSQQHREEQNYLLESRSRREEHRSRAPVGEDDF